MIADTTPGGVHFRECRISRDKIGAAWPLTVPWARLRVYASTWITVRADGREYAVNGLARSCGFASVEPIWAGDPDTPRKNIAPLFDIARDKLGHVVLSAAEIAALPRPSPPLEE